MQILHPDVVIQKKPTKTYCCKYMATTSFRHDVVWNSRHACVHFAQSFQCLLQRMRSVDFARQQYLHVCHGRDNATFGKRLRATKRSPHAEISLFLFCRTLATPRSTVRSTHHRERGIADIEHTLEKHGIRLFAGFVRS